MSKRTLLLAHVFLFAFANQFCFAQQQIVGEVININYQFKTVFTDLTSKEIKAGQIVEVRKNGQTVSFLKVIEAYDIMSKLAPIQEKSLSATDEDFRQISIGDKVLIKRNGGQQQSELIKSSTLSVKPVDVELGDSPTEIISELYDEKEKYRNEVSQLKAKLALVEEKLRKMSELINKNITAYEQ